MGGFKGVGDHWMFALASRVYFSFMKAIRVVSGGRWVAMRDHRVYLASLLAIWVRLGDLGDCWVVMLACRVYLASVQAIWVDLRGFGGHWVVSLDLRVYLAIWVVLGGLGGRWVVMTDCIWPL